MAADQMALCRITDRALRVTREFSIDRFAARRPVLLRRLMKRRPARRTLAEGWRAWQDRQWIATQ